MWKWFRGILILVIFAPIVGAFAWYSISFLPYLSELNSINKQGKLIVSTASDTLYPLAIAGESKQGIRTYAIKQAYSSLVYEKKGGSNIKWHLNNMLWYVSSHVHFTNEEIFNVWAYYAPYERGHGLNNAAMYYFNKPLSQLDERGYAALVAAVRSPSRYKPGTERSEQRIDEILRKAKNS